MMKKILAASALALLSTQAFAGTTCATATVIRAPGAVSGDTSAADGGHDIDAIGPLPLAGAPSAIYKFTLAAGDTANGTITVNASWPWGLFITPNCQATTSAPLDATTSGSNTLTLTPANYTAGSTYYVILSGDPGSAAASNAGAFSLAATATLPVTLQNFSID